MFSEAAPKPRLPNKRPLKSVLHVSPLELARQMALIEYDIFARIRPIVLRLLLNHLLIAHICAKRNCWRRLGWSKTRLSEHPM